MIKPMYSALCYTMILASCNLKATPILQPTVSSNEYKLKDNPFLIYFNSLPIVKEKFTVSSNQISGYVRSDFKSVYLPEGAGVIGRLELEGNNYCIIYTYPADIILPILEVYDEKGNKLREYELFDSGFCSDITQPNNFCRFNVLSNSIIQLMSIESNADGIEKIVSERKISLTL